MKSVVWYKPTRAQYVPGYIDMLKAPHLLIAGTTGSGKSVVLNGIIYSALAKLTPAEAGFCFIDPKGVELSMYKNLPHCIGYAIEAQDALDLLRMVENAMRDRFKALSAKGGKKSDDPHIYVVIDELADLMISDYAKPIKKTMQAILQLGRAVNIHIIAATQAPNRQIIPANLVLNFTNRIALRCLSSIESRQIINQAGAETLPQYGSFLYLSPSGVSRINSVPLIPDSALSARVAYWRTALRYA